MIGKYAWRIKTIDVEKHYLVWDRLQQTTFHLNESQFRIVQIDHVAIHKLAVGENEWKCVLSFEGSNMETGGGITNDLGRFVGVGYWFWRSTDWCGLRVHRGIKDELFNIVYSDGYQATIKPALQTCNEVIVVGHSLGGALADVFTGCANSGNTWHKHY